MISNVSWLNRKNINIKFVKLVFQYLPKEELYAPPLNIRVLDNRSFGRKPTVGLHVIKSLADHAVPAITAPADKEDAAGWYCITQALIYQHLD